MKEAMDSQQYKSDSNDHQSKGVIQYMQNTITRTAPSSMSILLPLALAQFICSYAASNMNVSISVIAKDLGTDVSGIQRTITFFTLTMAALMIPGSRSWIALLRSRPALTSFSSWVAT